MWAEQTRLGSGGTLQSAPAVNGQWSNVTSASSPHSAPLTGTQQYFRVRP